MNKECPYSSSCFECPLPDCHIDAGLSATTLNVLPMDIERGQENIRTAKARQKRDRDAQNRGGR